MCITMKENEEEILLKKLKKSPNNLGILNKIAIFYLNNPSASNNRNNPELGYFKKAYGTKKTVESTNNLAYYLYFEDWEKEEEAIKIQKECISLNPNSYIPYALYGYFLLDKDDYNEAIKVLEKAKEIFPTQQVLNNLAIAYFHQGNLEKAREILKTSIKEHGFSEYCMYNLSIIYSSENKVDKSIFCLEEIEKKIKNNYSSDIDYIGLAVIYSILNEHKKASKLALTYAGNFDFISYKGVAYSLFSEEKDTFYKELKNIIDENKETISEIEANHEDWHNETEEEKQLIISEKRKNILSHKNLEREFKVSPPALRLKDELWIHPCPCLLFGCSTHANPDNDQ